MNNQTEIAFSNHIKRLEKDISERDASYATEQELNRVDAKNIASLREARVPQYSDHIDCLIGNDSMDMSEFADLSELAIA